jgi:acetoin utilization deacetylase AcuC-like enzyme
MMKTNAEGTKKESHSDTSFSAGSLRAARRAAGAVQHAVDCVLVGRHRNAFCVVRPPGHHAGIKGLLAGGESCGFCIFNNVAAGALHAISDERLMCQRCAIVDIDVHHGNGTEEIVKQYHDPGKLFFFSIHLYDADKRKSGYSFYPGTGDEDSLAHNIINVPIAPLWRETAQPALVSGMPAQPSTHNTRHKAKHKATSTASSTASTPMEGSVDGDESPDVVAADAMLESDTVSDTASVRGSASDRSPKGQPNSPRYNTAGRHAYRKAVQSRLLPALRAFNPDLILISAGFDAAKGDVGNARHYAGGKESMGLDLEPEDYAWTTRKIMEIADICCQGRVVSVLEGGYGRSPTQIADSNQMQSLDKAFFSECAIRHLHGMVDPYDLEARFPSEKS